jgi:branched-chain amino acid aminotransferase
MSAPRNFDNLTFSLYPNANETMMFECYYRNGKWEEGKISQFHPLQLSPAANILNYGQGIFEGMKAYRAVNGSIVMFRPEENAKRFAHSCEVMAMPKVPEELYMQAVKDVVIANREFVPESQGGKYSLYLRPVCIGIEAQLGVKPDV